MCAKVCRCFDVEVQHCDGVFIHNDGLGPTRGANECHDCINDDAIFFLHKNRGYVDGDGIAVIAKVSFSHMLLRTLNRIFYKVSRKV